MSVQFRNYTNEAGITEDYYKVREFFIKLGYAPFTYVRWDWMITHSYLNKSAIGRIGLWEDNAAIVGIAAFDCQPGEAFCLNLPGYDELKKTMLHYSEDALSENDKFGIIIHDRDLEYQELAAGCGYIATTNQESDARFNIETTPLTYQLPEGFRITSMKDTPDLYQYRRVLWKGFNHELNGEGQFSFSEEEEKGAQKEMFRPNVDLELKVAVVAPDGNFVSYCGMWYDPEAGYAVVEPVATDPDYRKMGLGKAAVLEGLRRVGLRGAKTAYVGSSQQFYYNIGFRPYTTSTVWRKR